jgi:L-alanine-DL-glutamate epimerase-like enolase superfamily enzyme
MRIGSRSLGEFPLDVVRIECERCGRAGSYRRDGLMARFGVDIALPDLLMELAQCERRIRHEMQFKLTWAHRP